MRTFVAIDVETANCRMSSICQIGLVAIQDGQLIAQESVLIDPQDEFDLFNVQLHGIDADKVRGEPTFPDVFGPLFNFLKDKPVVCHTHFDRVALMKACEEHGCPDLNCDWIDSARVARRTWPQFRQSGFGLANLADFLGIEFAHHDASEDARAAAMVMLEAMDKTGLGIYDWKERLSKRERGPSYNVKRDGDGDGSLVGERLVFTGALQMVRAEAADMAHEAGGAVDNNVTKKTTMLIVGEQDLRALAGHKLSSKHRKALDLNAKGGNIRIVGEQDFVALCEITE